MYRYYKFVALISGVACVALMLTARADEQPPLAGDKRVSTWVDDQYKFAFKWILENIVGAKTLLFNIPDDRGLPGAVIAAPSVVLDSTRGAGEVQNYNWNWKRDAATTMRLVVRLIGDGSFDSWPVSARVGLLKNYVNFCETEQLAHLMPNGEFELGHAKSNLRGEKYEGPWGYPQNDGPPLQNIVLDEIIRLLSAKKIVDPALRVTTLRVFRRNVTYILKNYDKAAVERWEEVKAKSHFSILLEERKALLVALSTMDNLTPVERALSPYTADQLKTAVKEIETLIEKRHLSKERGYILADFETINDESLVRDKKSQLDMQVIMSSLLTNKFWEMHEDTYMSPSDPWVRATFNKLREQFVEKYAINKNGIDPATGERIRGVAFGRYPEDRQHFKGSPWFITSFAAVQSLLWDAMYIHEKKHVTITDLDRGYFLALNTGLTAEDLGAGHAQPLVITENDPRFAKIINGLVKFAKETYYRATVHGGDGHHLTEVFDPWDGHQFGIEGLTWTYVESMKTIRMLWRAQNQFHIDLHLALPNKAVDCVKIIAEPVTQ
jgi:glucoamylase